MYIDTSHTHIHTHTHTHTMHFEALTRDTYIPTQGSFN
jgi:hypothetical protein